MDEDERSFSEGVRIYTVGVLSIWDRKGIKAVEESLKETFADETLADFPNNLTKESLVRALKNLKRNRVKYRADRFKKGN